MKEIFVKINRKEILVKDWYWLTIFNLIGPPVKKKKKKKKKIIVENNWYK